MKRTLITLAALIITTAAYAHPHPAQRRAGGPGGPGPRAERIAEILQLTAAQQAQWESLRAGMESTMRGLREQQKPHDDAIKAALEAGDATAAGKAMLAKHALRRQMKAARDSFRSSVSAMLSPEQKARWDVLEQVRRPRR